MADLTQAVTTTRDSIGRYFSVVSALPSAILVGWTVLLVGSGAWNGRPEPIAAIRTFGDLGVGGTAGLLLATLALGVVLHPVQFAFVQFLEGYWGPSRLARRLRHVRTMHHWRRLGALRAESARIQRQIGELEERLADAPWPEQPRLEHALVELHASRQEIDRATADAPANVPGSVMPTRLGNVLRHYEWRVGKPYGLGAVVAVPYLSRTAAAGDMDYVNDQRSQLDLAVRTVVISLIATALAVLFLARHGLWLLVAIVPYGAAYLAYRGAVVIAAEYGRALGVLVALNRFTLYDRLRLPPVAGTTAERERNAVLMEFLTHDTGPSLDYRVDVPPALQAPEEVSAAAEVGNRSAPSA